MKESNAVTNENKDIKKLNASLAIMSLSFIDAADRLNEDQYLMVRSLCERLANTPIYTDGRDGDKEIIHYTIRLIEEYLHEEGV